MLEDRLLAVFFVVDAHRQGVLNSVHASNLAAEAVGLSTTKYGRHRPNLEVGKLLPVALDSHILNLVSH